MPVWLQVGKDVTGRLEEEPGGCVGQLLVDGGGVDAVNGIFQRVALLFGENLNHAGGYLLLQILEFLGRYVGVGHIFVSFAMARSVPK